MKIIVTNIRGMIILKESTNNKMEIRNRTICWSNDYSKHLLMHQYLFNKRHDFIIGCALRFNMHAKNISKMQEHTINSLIKINSMIQNKKPKYKIKEKLLEKIKISNKSIIFIVSIYQGFEYLIVSNVIFINSHYLTTIL